MAFHKWNTSGELTWSDNDVLTAADLNDSIDEVMPPIGAVIAWLKSFTSVPQTLPSGWMECDGSTISDADSPLNGETVPDLNGDNRFLRGETTSGGTGGADTINIEHLHVIDNSILFAVAATGIRGGFANDSLDRNTNNAGSTTQSILPTHYEVVWILRFK